MNIFRKSPFTRIASVFLLTAVLSIATIVSSSMGLSTPNNNLPASSTLIAVANQSKTTYPTDDNRVEGLLYSDSNEVKSLNSIDDFVSPETQKALLDPAQIPAVRQPIIDRSNPDNKLLEKTAQMFKDAGNFSAN